MIILYKSGGASDFEVYDSGLILAEAKVLFVNAAKVLESRNLKEAAHFLRSVPFEFALATNHLGDDFPVLRATVPLSEYETLRKLSELPTGVDYFRKIAGVLGELGHYVRFITVDLRLESATPSQEVRREGLSDMEIQQLVNRYIGVSGGYLGDFSYRTHREFYLDLDLDIDPGKIAGTTRGRFIEILRQSPPQVQAKILEGIVAKYPAGSSELRTPERCTKIANWISRLKGVAPVANPVLRMTSEFVERALNDAETLLKTSGAPSSVDRIHAALHAYLANICKRDGIALKDDPSLTDVFKAIRANHPALADLGPRPGEITRVVNAMATILDAMNPIRNRSSVAHPSETLLPPAEASLVVHLTRSLLHYLDAKFVSEPHS